MDRPGVTTHEMYKALRARGSDVAYTFGARPVVLNVDLQRAYTAVDSYPTAYAEDAQIRCVNRVVQAARNVDAPVVWTYVAYESSAVDCGIWGTRSDTEDSLQNILDGSPRATLDRRLDVDAGEDLVLRKRMPSAFFQTPLPAALVQWQADTIIITGGSTSGCVRATAVDAISHGYATFVVEDAVGDVHESPHYGALYDLAKKYCTVRPAEFVAAALEQVGSPVRPSQ